jgi:quercetin dioxygenase-like cupin family protein
MADRYTRVDPEQVELRERRGGGPASRDLAGALGAEEMVLRLWRFGPGHEMAYHRHQNQEELYHLVSGGPQELLVEGEVVSVADGEWVRIPKDTTRRVQNHTDRDAVWLIAGAPRGEGIMDGIRVDPETGQEIPRS